MCFRQSANRNLIIRYKETYLQELNLYRLLGLYLDEACVERVIPIQYNPLFSHPDWTGSGILTERRLMRDPTQSEPKPYKDLRPESFDENRSVPKGCSLVLFDERCQSLYGLVHFLFGTLLVASLKLIHHPNYTAFIILCVLLFGGKDLPLSYRQGSADFKLQEAPVSAEETCFSQPLPGFILPNILLLVIQTIASRHARPEL